MVPVNLLTLLVLVGQVPVDGATAVMPVLVQLLVPLVEPMGEAEEEETLIPQAVPVLPV